jgi:Type III restriction enzyme, res subunit
METLIWLLEAPESEKVGVDFPSDGGLFKRLCSKMATGSGKTIVMAMLISWQVLNAESQEESQNAPDLEQDEQEEETVRKLSKKEQAELLRQTGDTVGQIGKPGEQIQKVISE